MSKRVLILSKYSLRMLAEFEHGHEVALVESHDSGLGVTLVAKCLECGAEWDISDYEEW